MAWVMSRRQKLLEGALRVDGAGVFFNEERLCARDEIDNAFVTPRHRAMPLVVIRRRRGAAIRLEVDDSATGHEIIRTLQLDPAQKVATLHLPTMRQGLRALVFGVAAVAGFGALAAAVVFQSLDLLGGAALAVVLYLLFLVVSRTNLQVGADGLRLSCLGARRFIEYGDIQRVTPFRMGHQGVEITLRSSEVVRLPTSTHAAGDGGLASGLVEMIETAAGGHGGDAAREESLLARGGRDAVDWLRQIRRLGAGANADHRTAPIESENVWRVLENPAADPSARVGAAALLATSATDDERARLRVVANGIAAPNVRIAMDALLGASDDEAVLEVLEPVEERRRQK